MSLSCLQTCSPPSWTINIVLTTCTVHIGSPCVGSCSQRNFADHIEGACRLPPLRPLLCTYQTIYKTWQAHKEARQRPGAWHLNLHEALPFGGQIAKVGGGSNSDFPFLVEYKRLCNSTLWWSTIYSPASLTLLLICVMWHRQCKLVMFYHLDVVQNKNCLENIIHSFEQCQG